jgi:excisionase family DNA binding protein
MTVKQAAAQLECSIATVYQLCRAQKLGHYRVGARGRGTIRITKADVDEFRSKMSAPREAPETRAKEQAGVGPQA